MRTGDSTERRTNPWHGLWTLTSLDSQRFQGELRKHPKALLGSFMMLIFLGLLAASRMSTPSGLFFLSSYVCLLGLTILCLANSTGLIYTRQTDWWLGYPYPRWVLVFAKWLVNIISGLRLMILLMLLTAVVYVLMWTTRQNTWIPTGAILAQGGELWLLTLLYLPVFSALSVFLLGLMTGWARVFQIPVYGVMWTWVGILPTFSRDTAFITLGSHLRWLVWVVGVGWSVAALVLWLAVWRLPKLAGVSGWDMIRQTSPWWRDRYNSKDEDVMVRRDGAKKLTVNHPPSVLWGKGNDKGISATMGAGAGLADLAWVTWFERVFRRPAPPWWVLVGLEASRMRWFGFGADIRMTAMVTMLPFAGAVGGYFLQTPNLIISLPASLILFGGWLGLWMSLGVSQRFLRESVNWWLGYPYSRTTLILTRATSWFLRVAGLIFLTEMGLAVGMAVREVIHSQPSGVYVLAFMSGLRAGMIWLVAVPILQLILQTAPYVFRGWLLLLVPIIFGAFAMLFPLYGALLYRWIVANPRTGMLSSKFWWLLMEIAIIGVPLVIWFVQNGAKHIHVLATRRDMWMRG